jgi:hypothetical protein
MAAVGCGLHSVLAMPTKSYRLRPVIESAPVWARINPEGNYAGCRALMVKYPGLPFLPPEIHALRLSGFDRAQLLETFQFVQFFGRRPEGEPAEESELWYRKICTLLYTYIGCLGRY